MGVATARRRVFLGSIRRALLLLPVVVLAPVLLFQGWIFERWIRHEKQDEVARNLEVARSFRTVVEGYLDGLLGEEATVGLALARHRSSTFPREILGHLARYRGVREALWADASGRVLVATGGGRAGEIDARLREALRRGPGWAVSDLTPAPPDGKPGFIVARRVLGPGGSWVGIVAAAVEPTQLETVFGSGRLGLGAVTLLDAHGQVLYRQPPVTVGFRQRRPPAFPALRDVLQAGKEVSFVARSPLDGQVRFFAAVPMPKLGWVALASRPVQEATRAAYTEIRRSTLGLGAVVCLSLLLAYFLGRAVSRPATRLEEYAEAIGQGRRVPEFREQAPRELQRIGDALDRMLEQLDSREASRNRAEAALRLSEERLRLSAEAGEIGTWDWDIVAGRLVWDATVKELVGLAPDEEPSYEEFASIMHPEDRNRVLALVEDSLETVGDYDAEYRIIRRDGQVRWVAVRGRAVAGPAGTAVRMIGIAMDITKRKEYESALTRVRDAEVLDRAKSEFMAVASHELHTPLNSIIGYGELLLDEIDGPLNPEQRGSVERIVAGGRRLVSLADAILDLSRMETTGVALTSHEFRLRERVEEALGAYEDRARRKGLSFSWSFAPGLPLVLRGDPDRLVQALSVVLDNAVKFTEEGAVAVRVTRHSTLGRRECLQFTIADTGVGVPREKQQTIFLPFEQVEAHETRTHEGMGLGLPICRGLVDEMGGRLWVESEPGRGSAFSFTACFEVP